MWEIFSGGDLPYSAISSRDPSRLTEEVCHRKLRLEKPPACPDKPYKIMHSCWTEVRSVTTGVLVGEEREVLINCIPPP